MSQRESPAGDTVAASGPLLSPPVVPSPDRVAPLEPSLRQALGLPVARDADDRPTPAAVPLAQLLADIHAGRATLPTYAPPPSDHPEAVARALATPDFFLIQGAAGTGKSFVASAILREAARRGWRVLFLARTPAALDRALLPLADDPAVAVARCLADGEALADLPPALRKTHLGERLRIHQEVTLGTIRDTGQERAVEAGALEGRCAGPLGELADLLGQERAVATALDQLHARRERLPTSAEGEAGPEELADVWARLRQTRADVAEKRADLERQLADCRQREQSQREELGRLQPLVAARQAGRWWSPNYWRTGGQGDVRNRAATLEQSCQDLCATALRTQQEVDQLQARLAEDTKTATAELERVRADLDRRIAERQAERAALHEHWRAVALALPDDVRPAEPTAAALDQARGRLAATAERLRREAAAAEQAHRDLERASAGLPDRLADAIGVVAATLTGLGRDPHFGADATPGRFDLLVLEEADQATEADLLAVADRARRWVFIGEPTRHPDQAAPRRNVVRGQRPAHLRPGFFQRLWARLHDDPSARPVAWRQDLDRLVCVLGPVAPGQERYVQPEPVVDHPDIVLHIASPPRQTPRLVEVAFPAGTPIEDAKAFVVRELDELPLQTRARAVRWDETADWVVAQFGGDLPGKSKRIDLGDGVFESAHLLSGHWQTGRLEFDKAAWTRDRAIAWLRARLGLAGHDRTLLLDKPQRACPSLACWLADLLDDGFRAATVPTPCVEFVTVPSLSDDRPGRRPEPARNGTGVATLAPKLKALRGGAGVEIHLAEPRRHDLLPRELRDVLGGEGLVNYLEAQAAVRLVREILDDAASRADLLAWQQAHPTCPGVAVLALYPAQVRLMRYLLDAVVTGPVRLEVALPEQMRHRDCAVAVVGLTRSHQHRAVTYGESPAQLILALTRPAQRLVLLGDPGTLLRRSQFADAVDHLDEAESEQEQTLAGRLVRYLQGHGALQRAFTIRELAGL